MPDEKQQAKAVVDAITKTVAERMGALPTDYMREIVTFTLAEAVHGGYNLSAWKS